MARFCPIRALPVIVPAVFAAGVAGGEPSPAIEVGLECDASLRLLTWTTRPDFNYQVESSADLLSWVDTGALERGTGALASRSFDHLEPQGFFRIREVPDLYGGSFLTLPEEGQEHDLIDGVSIAFDLNVFPELPAKLRVYRRLHNGSTVWQQIGEVSDFSESEEVKQVRGSVVWIPDVAGEYDIQAAAVNAAGDVIATAVRTVRVGLAEPPVITIIEGPPGPSETPVAPVFRTAVSSAAGAVSRVEFYDNGVLIGSDREAPFGDLVRDREGNGFQLLRGTHRITAKVFDSRGGVGETAEAFVVEVTGGNARPELSLVASGEGVRIERGVPLEIGYTLHDPDGEEDIQRVEAYRLGEGSGTSDEIPPFEPLVLNTTDWSPGTHVIKIFAVDKAVAASYPRYLTVYVEEPGAVTFAEALVEEIVDESTAVPSNPSFTGVEASTAIFEDGIASGLQMDAGIVMTTGLAEIWNRGNTSEHSDEHDVPTFPNTSGPGDPELEDRVAGQSTHDAAVLEFDLFCEHGQLEFEYQFGSEEYLEYVGNFNDAFLATVNGVVVSFVPDLADIVAVNSIHPPIPAELSHSGEALEGRNAHLFLDNKLDIEPNLPPHRLAHALEYDGITVRMRAHALVTPGEVHRIRLVIADVTDDRLDSGLFIKRGSVRTYAPRP